MLERACDVMSPGLAVPEEDRTRGLCEDSKNAFSHGDMRPFFFFFLGPSLRPTRHALSAIPQTRLHPSRQDQVSLRNGSESSQPLLTKQSIPDKEHT